MSKNLTAQQLADELGVTRQLIYYHAKKLPADEKIYDDDKTLVFSPSQQLEISSYMTETIKEPKNETPNNTKDNIHTSDLVSDEGEKARIIQTSKVSNAMSNIETNQESEIVSKEKEEAESSSLTKGATKEPSNDKEEIGASVSKDNDKNRSQNVKLYIQQVLREQIDALYPIKQQEEIQQSLFVELEEKNQQISNLHKLLDQQQQLALIAEQKHQKLLDTLGVEDVKQLEQIVKQAAKENKESTTETSDSPASQEKKNWFQRIFG